LPSSSHSSYRPAHSRLSFRLSKAGMRLALMGGVLGVALAYGGIQLLLYLQPAQLPRLNEIAVRAREHLMPRAATC